MQDLLFKAVFEISLKNDLTIKSLELEANKAIIP